MNANRRRPLGLFVRCALAMLLGASSAEARIVRLWYYPNNPPSPCCNDASRVVRVILQAAREFEAHTHGSVVFDWRGVTMSPPCGLGGNDLVIWWDPSLPGSPPACGKMLRGFFGCNDGKLGLNPNQQHGVTTENQPETGIAGACFDLRATIMHEMAHFFRETNGHPLQSVLTTNGPVGDLVSRHLWNGDMFVGGSFPPMPVLLLLDFYNDANGTVVSAGGTLFNPGINFTGSVSQGSVGHSYARVYATSWGMPRVLFEQGNGSGQHWSQQRVLSNSSFVTSRHRTCVVAHPWSNDVYALWADSEQIPLIDDRDQSPLAGSRQVVFVESHDGGHSFSAPAPLGSLRTRTGLSCTYDPVTQRVVAAVADHIERLIVLHRPIAAGGAWSTPVPLVGPFSTAALRTGETPLVSFDAYSSDGYGLISWWDSDDNDQHAMYIRYFASTGSYRFDSGYRSWITTPVVEEQLLSGVVPNVIAGQPHWALNTQLNGLIGRRRFRRIAGVTSEHFDLSSSTALDIYTGSGANRLFVETSYMRHLISN
jgi:hypothetical protein